MGAGGGKLILTNEVELKKSFDSFDKNKSGVLDGKERIEFAQAAKKMLLAKASAEDKAELQKLQPEAWLEEHVDKNKNGSLSWSEFKASSPYFPLLS